MVNSPTWFMDNWIYCADHTLRYKLKDGKFIYERGVSRGQWGLSQDDFGREYYNYNSDFLRATTVPEVLYGRNPDFPGAAGGNVQLIKDQSCWPSHPTPGVNRGYEKDQLREDGTLATCTATCGAGVYRASLFPKDFSGNVFIPEPAGNLVKRVVVEEKDGELTAKNVYDKTEFFTSTDERCRPVNAYTGPDGALYIVDMYRGIIQHKGFLTHYLIGNILDRKLEEPYDRGRIWRVVPDGAVLKTAKLPQASAELVKCLSDSNGWVRDTAQRLLVERKDVSVAPTLAKLLASAPTITKLHALWTLEGIGGLTPDLVTAALHDADPKVRVAAVRVADRTLVPELAKLVTDPSPEVWSALGFALSPYPEAQEAVLQLAKAHGDQALVREPILSGLRGRELETLEALLPKAPEAKETIGALGRAVMAEHRSAHVEKLLEVAAAQPANSTAQQALIAAAAGKGGTSSAKPKLIYLDAQPAILQNPPGGADGKTKPLLAALDARLAWPGKPGVPPPPVIKPLTAEQQKLYDGGKVVYETLCAACHQPTGTGMSGLAPALVDSNWVLGDPQILPRIVIYGLSGPLKVNNETWSLEMPPLGAVLNDEQIAGVLTYIRREWEHNASPLSVEQVAEIRTQNKDRTKAWSSEELEEILAAKHSAQR
jgi:mono/diheme cytochrome c family protein